MYDAAYQIDANICKSVEQFKLYALWVHCFCENC